jgi:hypothetical protein
MDFFLSSLVKRDSKLTQSFERTTTFLSLRPLGESFGSTRKPTTCSSFSKNYKKS